MKKFTAIISTLAVVASLTGCNSEVNTSEKSENSTEVSQTDSEIKSADSSISSSFPESSENSSDSQTELTTLDGSILDFSAATKDKYGDYIFDFAFIRYAKTPLQTTLDITDKSEWEQVAENQKVEVSDFIKINVGDKLENGLVVESATTITSGNTESGMYSAKFKGELTLGGVLYLYPDGEWYNINGGDLIFLADPAQSDPIPIVSSKSLAESVAETPFRFFNIDGSDFESSGDYTEIRLGNIADCEFDLSGTIRAGEYVKAKIKVNDLGGYSSESDVSGLYAKLIYAERL